MLGNFFNQAVHVHIILIPHMLIKIKGILKILTETFFLNIIFIKQSVK